jgi:uroporphyrinogen-III synthase
VHAVAQVDLEGSRQTAWSSKHAYAVGPKTADALRKLGFAPTGEETGNAAALASVIAKKKLPYLFLCGNRRRHVLPNALREAGTPFEELVVYETHPRSGIDLPAAEPGDWLVFFSPSGIEAVMRHADAPARRYRLAAIGPTTAEGLRARERTVEAVAERPSPGGLVAALQETASEV